MAQPLKDLYQQLSYHHQTSGLLTTQKWPVASKATFSAEATVRWVGYCRATHPDSQELLPKPNSVWARLLWLAGWIQPTGLIQDQVSSCSQFAEEDSLNTVIQKVIICSNTCGSPMPVVLPTSRGMCPPLEGI